MTSQRREQMLSIHEILVGARNLIDKKGLAKFALCDPWGRVCSRGAIYEAISGDPYFSSSITNDEHFDLATKSEAELVKVVSPEEHIVHWNNAPERTQKEVLAVFDQAIANTAPEPDLNLLAPVSKEMPTKKELAYG